MNYTVIIPKPFQKQLDRLPEDIQERIMEKIAVLEEEARPPGTVKLKGYDNEYRIRIEDYRVRYEVNDEEYLVLLLHCKHRKDVYKK